MPDTDPREVFGRLAEGMYLSGFVAERAMTYFEWLLEDDRWQKCGASDFGDFLGLVNLAEYRIDPAQRQRIAELIREREPSASNRSIARAFGVSHVTINRDLNGTHEQLRSSTNSTNLA